MDSGEAPQHNEKIENLSNKSILQYLANGQLFIEHYGWFILIGGIILYYLYQKYLPTYSSWQRRREEMKEEEEHKKDPDKAYQAQVSMEKARLRLQQQVNIDAEKRRIEQEQREEIKRQQKIEEWENHLQGKGYHNKTKKGTSDDSSSTGYIKPKKTLRKNDYNPLGGSSSGSSYRPERRSNL